ncbi:DUF676-domain-containing protein [Rhizopus microsporus]|uniref:DUF676-domain-containing protein n=1 Tax=Rhizopus microsporus TaxID=58291 RepID=A0A1X0S3V4_RHIZD|nr:DUF676-domain-containing protein [Rhizopus microsporus]
MTESDSISLVVLSHGLWGNKGHMNYIKNQLIQRYKNSIYVIQKTIKRLNNANKKVVKISMIGYSLGGLILRYAIGVLGEKGVFEDVIPDYFITFATPHMGVRLPDKGFFSKIFNFTTSKFISRSGEQLQLRDKFGKKEKPLIQTLSDPGIHSSLVKIHIY